MKYIHLRDQNGRRKDKKELQRQSRAGWESVRGEERRGKNGRECWRRDEVWRDGDSLQWW